MFSEWLLSLRLRLRAIWKRKQLERDLQEEVQFHLAMRQNKLKSSGVSQRDAHYAAHRAFGNVVRVKEDTRMLWTFRWFEDLRQDVRYAARSLRRSPTLAAVVVLSLALGIGANTAIFSLIDAVMLRVLPIDKPEDLTLLRRGTEAQGSTTFTNPLWESVRDHQDIFSGTFAWSSTRFDLARGGAVHYVRGMFISGAYFRTLGIKPAAGRLIVPVDDQRGCAPTAVLSYGFWQDHFGAAPDAIGTTVSLDHQLFQVIGVSPPGFYGVEVGDKFDVAVPVCSAALFDGKTPRLEDRSWWWLSVIGRLAPGVTLERANARLAVLSPAIMESSLPENWDTKSQQDFLKSRLAMVPAATGISYLRRTFREPLDVLMIIVAVVLLIACANIATLMLARATARTREFAVRNALGASRSRLVRQLLTESLLLSSLGAVLGLLFARWGGSLLVRNLSTGQAQVFLDLALDRRILVFTVTVAVLTGILVGFLPALRSSSLSLSAAMKGSLAADDERGSRFRAGKWIVASQLSLSLILLIGGGLLLRTFVKLLTLDMGFDATNVMVANVRLDSAKVPVEQRPAVYGEIDKALRYLPGINPVSRSWTTPLSGLEWDNLIHADSPNAPTGDAALAFFNFVSPTYFQTMRTPLLSGREFNNSDAGNAPGVAIINQTLAKKFFPGLDPIGKTFRVDADPGKPRPVIQIVGIVKDSKYLSLREETFPTAFFPIEQIQDRNGASFVYELRTSLPPSAVAASVQQVVGKINKEIPLELHRLTEQVDDSLIQERLLATLSSFFGGLALLLAMIGLYGAISYLVTQRRTEFGIRMALGAQRSSIWNLVMKDVLAVVIAGVTAGIAVSFVATTLLRKLLYGLAPHDLFTMVVGVGVLSLMAILAAAIPARRAARVDPMVALRCE